MEERKKLKALFEWKLEDNHLFFNTYTPQYCQTKSKPLKYDNLVSGQVNQSLFLHRCDVQVRMVS